VLRFLSIFLILATSCLAQLEQPLVPINSANRKVTLSIYNFSDQKTKVNISQNEGQLGATLQTNRKLGGVSIGITDRYGKLTGQSILNGKNIGGATTNTGAKLTIANGKIAILPANQVSTNKIQIAAAPYLLQASKTPAKLDGIRHARRTFILTDNKGNWAIGYAPNMTEAQLAFALKQYTAKSAKKFNTALQLSSGNQCGFWAAMQGYHPYYLKEINKPQMLLSVGNR